MPKKAQMFIVTMVFLVGLIFTVQQILFQYTFLDISKNFEKNDYYLLENIKDVYNKAIQQNTDCSSIKDALQTLTTYLKRQIITGYSLDLNYFIDDNCENPVNGIITLTIDVNVRITGKGTETTDSFKVQKILTTY